MSRSYNLKNSPINKGTAAKPSPLTEPITGILAGIGAALGIGGSAATTAAAGVAAKTGIMAGLKAGFTGAVTKGFGATIGKLAAKTAITKTLKGGIAAINKGKIKREGEKQAALDKSQEFLAQAGKGIQTTDKESTRIV